MIKIDLINDMNFRNKCCEYGLDWEKFDILDDIIVMTSPKDNLLVLMDEHYNTIGICNKNDEIGKSVSLERRIKGYKMLYETSYSRLAYPFQGFSIKQIVDLANRVYIHETNHGHSSKMIVNGMIVNDECDNVYTSLLSYIKFLGQQINQYYKYQYQMELMGFEYPDVYKYILRVMINIDECIDINIQNGDRPFPINIIKYLGQDRNNIEKYDYELYSVIDLLLKQKGVKVKSGFKHYKELEMTEKDTTDLSAISKNLLKILEETDEEIELRYQESNKTHEIKEVNLQSWLSESINKDKPLVLTKSKNIK